MLAADVFAFHNMTSPGDVDNDGVVNTLDVFLVVDELRADGERSLIDPNTPAPGEPDVIVEDDPFATLEEAPFFAGEGEVVEAQPLYFDVNGDNKLSTLDVFYLLDQLRGEGVHQPIEFQVQTTFLDGVTPISQITVGNEYLVHVFVEDIRTTTADPDKDVLQAFLDLEFTNTLTSVVAKPSSRFGFDVTFGNKFNDPQDVNGDPEDADVDNSLIDINTNGLIDDIGSIQDNFGFSGPLGAGQHKLFTVKFMADVAGTVNFTTNQADSVLEDHRVVISDPIQVVNGADIIFGGTLLTIIDSGASDDALTIAEDDFGPHDIDVLANDTPDTLGSKKISKIISGPANGTASIIDPGTPGDATDDKIRYIPNANFFGSDTVVYEFDDGVSAPSQATVFITVTPVADIPLANADSYTTNEDQALIVSLVGNRSGDGSPVTAGAGVLDNDTDGDPGTTLSAVLETGPNNGNLTAFNADGTFTYVPSAKFSGFDTFTYKANDGGLDSAPVTVTIEVIPSALSADDPVAVDDSYTVNEDQTLTVSVIGNRSGNGSPTTANAGVLDNDTDADQPGTTLSAVLDTGPNNGNLTVFNADGTFTYVPNANFFGTDTFTYLASDSVNNSNLATVTIDVIEQLEVQFFVQTTLLDGTTPISAIRLGDEYLVQVFVEDTRSAVTASDKGVVQAFLDLEFTNAFTSVVANVSSKFGIDVTFGPDYNDPQDGNGDPVDADVDNLLADINAKGLIDDIGSIQDNFGFTGPLGAGQHKLFTVKFTADAAGTVDFTTNQADSVAEDHRVILNRPASVVDPVDIVFGGASLTIVDAGAEDDTLTIAEDDFGPHDIDVLANDTPAPTGSKKISQIISGPANGSAVIFDSGTPLDFTDDKIRYIPNANFFGSDTIVYEFEDGVSTPDQATVFITVTPVADIPLANADGYTTNEDQTLIVSLVGNRSGDGSPVTVGAGVLDNDTDADQPGTTLSAMLETGPSNGNLTAFNADGTFTYVPNASFSGFDTFTYKANDGGLDSTPVTVTIEVIATASPNSPVAIADSYSTDEGQTLTISVVGNRSGDGSPPTTDAGVLDNDTDADAGTTLSAVLETGPSNGNLTAFNPDGTFTYVPNASFSGFDTFTYKANDGGNDSAPVTVTIEVIPIAISANDPVAVNDNYTINEDQTLTVSVIGNRSGDGSPPTANAGILDNDTDADAGTTLSAVLQSGPSSGSLTAFNADGTFTYVPTANFFGTDTFTYLANDGVRDSNLATVTIDVIEQLDVQFFVQTTLLDGTTPISAVRLGDEYLVHVFLEDTRSAITATDKGVVQAFLDLEFTNAFTSVVANASSRFGIDVTFGPDYNDPQDGNGDPVDADIDNLLADINSKGLLDDIGSIQDNFGFGGPLGAGQHKLFTVRFTADSLGTVDFTTNQSDSVTEDHRVILNRPAQVVDPVDIVFGGATLTIVDAGAEDDTLTIAEDDFGPHDIDVLANDIPAPTGSKKISQIISGPANGTAVIFDSGTPLDFTDDKIRYIPNANFFGSDTIVYEFDDGVSTPDQATVFITVTPLADSPVAVADGYTTNEDQTLIVSLVGNRSGDGSPVTVGAGVLDNDTDADQPGTTLSAVLETSPNNGNLTAFNPDGTFTYVPNAKFSGFDTFTYTANDGGLDSAPVTVTIEVIASTVSNNDPVAVNDSYTVNEDQTLTVSAIGNRSGDGSPPTAGAGVLDNDTDADAGTTLSAVLQSGPSNGNLTVFNVDGTFTYVPNANFFGTDTFTYLANDGANNSNLATVTIDVIEQLDVQFFVQTTLLDGTTPISAVRLGDEYLVHVFLEDTRSAVTAADKGVVQAFLDLEFTNAFTSVVANASSRFGIDVTFGPDYNDPQDGNGDPGDADVDNLLADINAKGLIDDIGSIQDNFGFNGPLGAGQHKLFTVKFTADSLGTVDFTTNQSDSVTEDHRVILNRPAQVVDPVDIVFGGASLAIVVAGATDDALTIAEDDLGPHDIDVLANDVPAPSGSKKISQIITGPANGSAAIFDSGTPLDFTDDKIRYIPNANFFGSDTIVYEFNDGVSAPEQATVNITVTEVNDAPVANTETFNILLGGTLNFNGSDLVTVADTPGPGENGQTLTFLSVNTIVGTQGKLIDNGGGNFTYEPPALFVGTDQFEYTIIDNGQTNGVNDFKTATGIVNVIVSGSVSANDPVAVNDNYTVNEDQTLTVSVIGNRSGDGSPPTAGAGVLDNDTDADSGTLLTATLQSGPSNGNLTALNADGTFTYVPNANFFGTDTFTYQTSDGVRTSGLATVTINVIEQLDVQFTVLATRLDGVTPITSELLLGEEYLIHVFVEDTRSAVAAIDKGVVQAFLDLEFSSTNGAVTSVVADASNRFGINVTFGPDYNDPQDSNGDPIDADVDNLLADINANGLIDDIGSIQDNFGFNGPLGAGQHQLFTVMFTAQAGGTVNFTTNQADSTTEDHRVILNRPARVVDQADIAFGGATVQIKTSGALDDALTIAEDDFGPHDIDVLFNDVADPLGAKKISQIISGPANGTAVIFDSGTPGDPTDDKIRYIPNADFFGSDTIIYEFDDGVSGTVQAQVNITVTDVNDAPVTLPDTINVLQGKSLTFPGSFLLAGDTPGPGEGGQQLTFTGANSIAGTTQGTVKVDGSGNITYTPFSPAFLGTDQFEYTIIDNGQTNGVDDFKTSTGIVNVVVADRFELVGITLETRDLSGGLITDIGVGDFFEVHAVVEDLRLVGANLGVAQAFIDLLYDPSFVATVDMTPVAPENFDFAIEFGSDFDDPVNTEAIDNGADRLDEVGSVFDGFSTGNSLGSGKFLLFKTKFQAIDVGTTTFNSEGADDPAHTIRLSDPNTVVDLQDVSFGGATLEITNLSPNDPVAQNDSYTIDEDNSLIVNVSGDRSGDVNLPNTVGRGVLDNDTDPDQPVTTLTAILQTGPANGTLTEFNPDGTFRYVPNANFFGTDTFTYLASDGVRNSNIATVTITINAQDDIPIANDDLFLTNVSTPLNVIAANGVLANDRDFDTDPGTVFGTDLIAVQVGGVPANAQSFTLNADGSFNYTPFIGFIGIDTFQYFAQDAQGNQSDTITVVIGVGVIPHDISGSVYMDRNNDGIRDATENGIAGIEIALEGPLSRTTITAFDGSYTFKNVLPGSYAIIQRQPSFLIDGLDSISGVAVVGSDVAGDPKNDRFEVVLTSVADIDGLDFGELGKTLEYIEFNDLLASTNTFGITLAVDSSGGQLWQSFKQNGWGNFIMAKITNIADDRSTVTLEVMDTSFRTFRVTIEVANNPNLHLIERPSGFIIDIVGSSDDFDLQLIP